MLIASLIDIDFIAFTKIGFASAIAFSLLLTSILPTTLEDLLAIEDVAQVLKEIAEAEEAARLQAE